MMKMIIKIDQLLDLIEESSVEARVAMVGSFRVYLQVMFYVINESFFIFKPFHKEIIRKLEGLVRGTNEKRNLILNIPVGSGKSLIIQYFITWCFARTVNNAFVYISHSDTLIMKLSKEAKEICEHPVWVSLFSAVLKTDMKSKANWAFNKSKNRTGLTASPIGSGVTGLDAGNPNIKGFSGALIIDDPMDAAKARYETERKNVQIQYSDKLETRRRTPTVPTILIMQRLHKDDLTGFVLGNEANEWDVLKVKAMENDVSFWPERYPIEELQKIKTINAFKYAGQYNQNPITDGGQVIKSKWFKYYVDINEIKFDRLFMTGDTAQKTKEHNDYSVFCAWGVYKNNLYLLDLLRGKWESPDLKKNAQLFWSKWRSGHKGVLFNAFYVEDKVSGTDLIQNLQASSNIPIIGVQRNTDKLLRLEDVLPYIESGRFYLPVSPEYSFNPEVIAECESFARDMSHAFDDIVDNIIDGINNGLALTGVSILDVL